MWHVISGPNESFYHTCFTTLIWVEISLLENCLSRHEKSAKICPCNEKLDEIDTSSGFTNKIHLVNHQLIHRKMYVFFFFYFLENDGQLLLNQMLRIFLILINVVISSINKPGSNA
jgi:hypothetical protein